ncbi:SsrA-binding protein SmpB [Alphaproteobacteria bacterium HT1-32]|nr:SsrA-binding protein SmpB [Alphaproteobacteria bacterium HT1-32]
MSLPDRIAAQNRKARHDFFILETIEAGIMLTGTEVKSLRSGRASIQESYASEKDGDFWLVNAHIPHYEHAGPAFAHELRRPRKLLLHRKEISRLVGAINRKGHTLVPLNIHFNSRGLAKVTLGLAKGKQAHDKRQTIKERDWERNKARVLRDNG